MLAIAYGWDIKMVGVSEIAREEFDDAKEAMKFIKNTLAAPYGAGRFVKLGDEYYATEWSDLKYGGSFKKLDNEIYILPMRKVIALAGVTDTQETHKIYYGLFAAGPHTAAIGMGIPAMRSRALQELSVAESKYSGYPEDLANFEAAREYVNSL
jgi:hypothetical protein